MACTVQRREAAHRIAEAAADVDGVVATDALEPAQGPRAGWTIEIVCEEPMPVELHELLAKHDFGVARATPRGTHLHVVAA